MVRCSAFTLKNRKCLREAKYSSFCSQHYKSVNFNESICIKLSIVFILQLAFLYYYF